MCSVAHGSLLAADEQMHHLLIVPQELPLGRPSVSSSHSSSSTSVSHCDALAGRKTLAREVPLLAQHFPGHDVFGILLALAR